MPIVQSWLDQTVEETLEPDLPICDPHRNLWDYQDSRYLLAELLSDTDSGHNIRSTVFVECLSNYKKASSANLAPVGETEFVEKILSDNSTKGTAVAAGLVAHANLMLADSIDEVLWAHRQASPERFRGIRHSASWDASDAVRNSHSNSPAHLYLNKKFRQGFARLANFDLIFDSWLYHPQLHELRDLAMTFPYQTIVLDHAGGPLGIGPYANKRSEVFAQWRKSIKALADCENVVAKLGGLGMAINGFGWHKEKIPPSSEQLAQVNRPYLEHCLDSFGVERCMFESNFPVDKVSSSYNILWNSFKHFTKDYSAAEKAQLYHDNAVRVYSL